LQISDWYSNDVKRGILGGRILESIKKSHRGIPVKFFWAFSIKTKTPARAFAMLAGV
jgi:hypothetical protein